MNTLLIILLYLMIFIASFGIFSYFNGYQLLANLHLQLIIGIVALVVALILLVMIFMRNGKKIIERVEEPSERVEEDNQISSEQLSETPLDEIIDNTTYIDTSSDEYKEQLARYTEAAATVQDEQMALRDAEKTIVLDTIVDETGDLTVTQTAIIPEAAQSAVNEPVGNQPLETGEEEVADQQPSASEEAIETAKHAGVDLTVAAQQMTLQPAQEEIHLETADLTGEMQAITEQADDLSEEVGEVVESSVEGLQDAQETLLQESEQTLEELEESAQEGLEKVERVAEEFALAMGDVVEDATQDVQQAAEEVQGNIAQVGEKVDEAVSETAQELVEEVEMTADSAVGADSLTFNPQPESEPDPSVLSDTQINYINQSDNSYLNTEGLPQLVMTGEVDRNKLHLMEEQRKKQEEKPAETETREDVAVNKTVSKSETWIRSRTAKDIDDLDDEDLYGDESTTPGAKVLNTIIIILFVAIVLVGGYYLFSRFIAG